MRLRDPERPLAVKETLRLRLLVAVAVVVVPLLTTVLVDAKDLLSTFLREALVVLFVPVLLARWSKKNRKEERLEYGGRTIVSSTTDHDPYSLCPSL